jgi:predicted CopG family antitoxin
MPKKSLSYPNHELRKTTPLHDEAMIALSTADKAQLISIITKCNPPITSFLEECGIRGDDAEEYRESTGLIIDFLNDYVDELTVETGVYVAYKQSADGVISLKYSFNSFKILVEVKTEIQSYSEVLEQINRYRNKLKITDAILICDTVSEKEALGFISQRISIYSATDLVLPMRANCAICAVTECPLNGMDNSPVFMCRRFSTEEDD